MDYRFAEFFQRAKATPACEFHCGVIMWRSNIRSIGLPSHLEIEEGMSS
jgi:hypothetical protein